MTMRRVVRRIQPLEGLGYPTFPGEDSRCPAPYMAWDPLSACAVDDQEAFEKRSPYVSSMGTCPDGFQLEKVAIWTTGFENQPYTRDGYFCVRRSPTTTCPTPLPCPTCAPQPVCSAGHLWDTVLKKCVASCPPGYATTATGACSKGPCPSGYFFDWSTVKCTAKTCPSGSILDASGNCVAYNCPTCPAPTSCPPLPVQKTCPSGQALNTSTGQCVSVICPSCPPQTVCPTCPPNQPQPSCPDGQLWDTQARTCVALPDAPAQLPWFVAMLGGAAALAAVGLGAMLGGA